MKVEMTFNDAAVDTLGYQKADIYQTIKSAFAMRGLRCSSDNEVLSFEDNGHEDDYAHMWKIIISLLKSDWFVACADSCIFLMMMGAERTCYRRHGKYSGAWHKSWHIISNRIPMHMELPLSNDGGISFSSKRRVFNNILFVSIQKNICEMVKKNS